MNNTLETYRYELEQGSRKYRCPSCEKKRFVRYVDSQTGECLPAEYGRCDREVNCGYFRTPYDDKNFLKENSKDDWRRPIKPKPTKPPKFIPVKLFKKSKSNYSSNNFVKYLCTLFDKKTVKSLIRKYHIGTAKKGGCIFYQIDIEKNIRRGKIMFYDSDGHRDKNYFGSVHKRLGIPKKRYPDWRFFGEHLLKDSDKTIAIVESEKTAIIASVYLPEFTWLATGTKGTLKRKYAESLQGRDLILFPDLGAFKDWQDNDLYEIANVTVSTLLEDHATNTDKKDGLDIADYLIRMKPQQIDKEDISKVIGTLTVKEFDKRYASYSEDELAKKGYFDSVPF